VSEIKSYDGKEKTSVFILIMILEILDQDLSPPQRHINILASYYKF
jgi:hypothetical protein